jgi:hypothetical protein
MRCAAFICLWLIVGGILANIGIVALALLAGFLHAHFSTSNSVCRLRNSEW